MNTSYTVCFLAGRCANGAERDKGRIWHAVPRDGYTALCGAEPGRRSAGWAPWDATDRTHEITCPRCLKALARLGATEPTVYSYAPNGAVAYDIDSPEGAAAAHRADMIAFPYRNAEDY